MKSITSSIMFVLATALALIAAPAFAVDAGAAYPYTTPTYIPNAVGSTVNFSAPGTYVLQNAGLGTVALEVSGTCTGLAATVQGLVGSTWTTVNIFPVTTGSISAASAVSAAGVWRTNSAAFKQMRLNITALTASCNVTMVGTEAGFTATY